MNFSDVHSTMLTKFKSAISLLLCAGVLPNATPIQTIAIVRTQPLASSQFNLHFGRSLANKLPAGFDSAQPACTLSKLEGCALSEVEGCALSGVEGSKVEGCALSGVEGCALSEVEGCALSGVEGCALSGVEGCALSGVEGAMAEDKIFLESS
jgi:hypothetical protein